jgi:hypothetical protein
MKKMYYSATENSFFPSSLKSRYIESKSWPKDVIEVTTEEWRTYGLETPPEGMQRGADETGRPAWVPTPPEPLDTLAARKRTEIDTARDAAFAAGLPYSIAGEPDVVQTRPQDQINLLGLSAKAQRLIAAGQEDETFTFRGLSNVNRTLAATEMDALALAALAHIESIYQQSWGRKDAIDAALEAGDREAIEAVTW